MVAACCVSGCTNRYKKGGSLKFFRVPRSKRQRNAWVRAINRQNFVPSEHTRVCSAHFVTGWPDFVDPHDIDFAPSIFPKPKEVTPSERLRKERLERRKISQAFERAADLQWVFAQKQLQASISFHDYLKTAGNGTTSTSSHSTEEMEFIGCNEKEDITSSQVSEDGKRDADLNST